MHGVRVGWNRRGRGVVQWGVRGGGGRGRAGGSREWFGVVW